MEVETLGWERMHGVSQPGNLGQGLARGGVADWWREGMWRRKTRMWWCQSRLEGLSFAKRSKLWNHNSESCRSFGGSQMIIRVILQWLEPPGDRGCAGYGESATFIPDEPKQKLWNFTAGVGGRCCVSIALMLAQTAELCSRLCNGDESPQPEITCQVLKENSLSVDE